MYNNRRYSRFSQNRNRGFNRKSIDVSMYINEDIKVKPVQNTMSDISYLDLNISDEVKSNIGQKGYNKLTPIQALAIPRILESVDLIGIAHTGTGKTAAFLIPFIEKVYKNRDNKVIILAPTRELASQINIEIISLLKGLKLYSALCIGGENLFIQQRDLQRPHNFLICTPGRLKDLIIRRSVDLKYYNNVVVDEVDRMFDMGFAKDIGKILDLLPKDRQTLFFSATLDKNTENLAARHLKDPVKISVSKQNFSGSIYQNVIRIRSSENKLDVLDGLLKKEDFSKVLIFSQTKRGVERLEKELSQRGFRIDSIHGDKRQHQRQKSLHAFKTNRVSILVATDVAARGLDIPNVSHVINYEAPVTYEDYIHRIGRTGRGDKTGVALTFI